MTDTRSIAATGEPSPADPRSTRVHDRDADQIERSARIGSWTLDPATGEATWSAEMFRILGLDPQHGTVDLPDISGLFTSESVERVNAAVARAIASGETWLEDLELRRPGGGWVLSVGIAELDDAGRCVRIRGTMQDVSEQRALEAQVRQSQRLEAIGQLAGGIAHDFNNLLTAIRGYADLARLALEPGHAAAEDLDHVVATADRASALVAQLLAFSRRQHLEPRVIEPMAVVDDLLPMLRRLLGASIEIDAVTERDLGRITVDPGQLGQVLVNLAVNARDAMPDGGRLAIELMNVELDSAYAAAHHDATPGPHVLIAVSDTGAGMDAATRARVFEPFFTTKAEGKGTGMGLATVYGIVRQSGGSIYLYSEPGRGTTLKLYFPRTDSAAANAAQGTAAGDAGDRAGVAGGGVAGGTETILLVEDDPDVRGYARRILQGAGYTVVEAERGNDAVVIAASHGDALDLLLTDVTLPGLSGPAVAAEITAARPGLRVLYMSGFTENITISRGLTGPGATFLPKPYRADDLLRAVRTLLAGTRT